jgi:plastocyanin
MYRIRLVASLIALALPATAGDVSGHAIITKRLTKKAPRPGIYNLRGAAPPSTPAETAPVDEFERMVVVLEGGPPAPNPALNLVIDQRGLHFEPDLVVVPVGSTVQFPNWDPIFHNVFSFSRAQTFDLGFYPRGQSRTVTFKREGIVQVYCHIHSNMYAAIIVTSSRWYGKPAPDGSFSFSNVPAGHYRVMAWHKIAGLHQKEIDVPQSGKTEVAIHIPLDVEPQP